MKMVDSWRIFIVKFMDDLCRDTLAIVILSKDFFRPLSLYCIFVSTFRQDTQHVQTWYSTGPPTWHLISPHYLCPGGPTQGGLPGEDPAHHEAAGRHRHHDGVGGHVPFYWQVSSRNPTNARNTPLTGRYSHLFPPVSRQVRLPPPPHLAKYDPHLPHFDFIYWCVQLCSIMV